MHPPIFGLIRPLQVLEQTDCFFFGYHETPCWRIFLTKSRSRSGPACPGFPGVVCSLRGGRVGRTPRPQAVWPPAAGTPWPGSGVCSLPAPFLTALTSIPSSQYLAGNAFMGRRLPWNKSTGLPTAFTRGSFRHTRKRTQTIHDDMTIYRREIARI